MRHLLIALLAMAGLVATVTGCGGRGVDRDRRLVAADSLMMSRPDSALALVEALCRDSLRGEGDRAYRDLLLTQARYRCYVTATSDSDINRALDYYRRHDGERHKLTRAYLYKGAVMEELGHPDSAMLYYKHAEASADPDDHFNLGYANLRMGALYRDHYAIGGKDIEKYEKANRHLSQTDNSHYRLACMINLGSLYRLKAPKRSDSILSCAKAYASRIGDTTSYIKCLRSQLQTCYVLNELDRAHQIIQEVRSLQETPLDVEFLTNAADVYAKLGKADSAELFLRWCAPPFSSVIDEMLYMESVGEIALARGDTATYRQMESACRHKGDSLQRLDASMRIMQAESAQDERQQAQIHRRHALTTWWLAAACLALLLAMSFLYCLYRRRAHRYDGLVAQLRSESSALRGGELEELRSRLDNLSISDARLRQYIDSHLSLMGELLEECYRTPGNKMGKRIAEIVSYQEQNKDKWSSLYGYIDVSYGHVMTETRSRFPQLNDRDMLLVALTVLDFSCVQIAMIMGYSNPTSVGVIKQRLAGKMGLTVSLREYIDSYLKN